MPFCNCMRIIFMINYTIISIIFYINKTDCFAYQKWFANPLQLRTGNK